VNARDRVLVVYRAGSDLAGRLAFLVLTIVAARQLSTADFGIFVLGSTLGWLAATISDSGMQMHFARAVVREPGRAKALLTRWLRARLIGTVVVLAIVAVAVSGPWITPGTAAALVLFVMAYLAMGLVEFVHHFYRGVGRTDIESRIAVWQRAASLVCGVLALGWRADAAWLAAALLVAPLASLAYSLPLARQMATRRQSDQAAPAAREPVTREFASQALPIGIGIVLSALYFRVDTFMIEYWIGPAAVGLYGAGFRIVDALRLFPAAVLAVTLPAMCRATDTRIVQPLALQLTLAGAAAAMVLALAASWLVPALYGAAFADAVPAFRVLLIAVPLMALNYALTQQLIAWDGHRAFAVCCGAALVVNIALNLRLLPSWSIVGAAWATVATEVVLLAGGLAALARTRRYLDAAPVTGAVWQEG
jgi:O-antigen/teichoic acid export membrane protein